MKEKKDPLSITYTHPSLEEILDNTYGCIVYQEQVMQIVRKLAGYSLGRSDLLRRAMGKKKIEVMQKEREVFLYGDGDKIHGCIAEGIPKEVGEKIFDDMADFAKYAFNKSHAAAYAVVAYQTAYLKTYYKVEFMAALMTSVMDSSGKISLYIESCKKMGIDILPPDINEACGYFTTRDNAIIYGLAAIKNVGKSLTERIVEERNKNGKFTSLTNFYRRMDSKDTNKRSIESLILAGAFDSLGGTRSQYMAAYKLIADGMQFSRKNNIEGQIDLFSSKEQMDDGDTLPHLKEYDTKQLLEYEKEVLGIYLSGHPLDKYAGILDKYVSIKNIELQLSEEDSELGDGQYVAIGGILVDKKVIYTKTNKKMAFIKIEDITGAVEVIIFPNLFSKFEELDETQVFLIKGRVSVKDEKDRVVIADTITTLETLLSPDFKECIILSLDETLRTKEIRQKLLDIFKNHRGKTKVIVESKEDLTKKPFPDRYNVTVSKELIKQLETLLGSDAVSIKS